MVVGLRERDRLREHMSSLDQMTSGVSDEGGYQPTDKNQKTYKIFESYP